MSTIARAPRLGWRLLPKVLAASLVVAVASLALAQLRGTSTSDPVASAGRAIVDIPAVPWTTDVYPVGAPGRLSPTERSRFEVQRDRIRTVVRNVAEAVVLSDGEIRPWVRSLLTGPAAQALKEARTGIPPEASDVEMITRRARIGVQAPGMEAAAARVTVELHGVIDDRPVSWRDNLTLWLERAQGSWRVIAFDVERTQLP